ncbi:MAG: protein-disulfide reductase DsbD domain-containing protein [Shimia sp.]
MLRRLLLSCALALSLTPAVAGPFDEVIEADILPGWRAEDGRHHAALRLRMAPGWHTYWRAPGDSGIPPRFDWAGSENLRGVAIQWPVPEVFRENGLRSLGYSGEVVIPLQLTARSAEEMMLDLNLSVGVCETVCVPAHLHARAVLPSGGEVDRRIRSAWADRPLTAAEAGAGQAVCRAVPIEDGMALSVRVPMPPIARAEEAAVEVAQPGLWVSEPAVSRLGGTLEARVDVVAQDGAPVALDRSKVRLTVIGGGRAVDVRGCVGG